MKRSAELRDLSDDHHRALVLAKRAKEIASSRDAHAIHSLWLEIRREYDSHLAAHFTLEEVYLLPPVCAAGGTVLAQRVEEDHAALRAYVLDEPHDEAALASFAQRLSDHVRFEERELFPYAEANLIGADFLRIAHARRETEII